MINLPNSNTASALLATVVVTLTLTFCAFADSPSSQPAPVTKSLDVTPPKVSRDRYDVIVRNNMFLKGGGTSSSSLGGLFGNSAPTTQTQPFFSMPSTPLSPEAAWVLTGTALRAGDSVAFMENSQTGALLRVHVGDTIEIGKITRIDANGIDFNSQTGTRRILVGSSMDGAVLATTLPAGWSQITPDSSGGASSGGSGGTSDSGGSDLASILERLKKRRNQELNK